jgi:hypothetical protein
LLHVLSDTAQRVSGRNCLVQRGQFMSSNAQAVVFSAAMSKRSFYMDTVLPENFMISIAIVTFGSVDYMVTPSASTGRPYCRPPI